MEELIQNAVTVLRNGGTLLYPTDTIWGIGCDASNPEAVEKIFAIKCRDHSKSMLVLVDTPILVSPDFIFPPSSSESSLPNTSPTSSLHSLSSTTPRPTTYIIPVPDGILSAVDGRKWRLSQNLIASDSTIGIRLPDHEFCLCLLKAFGGPIVSTSANYSGDPSPRDYEEISDNLKRAVDFALPPLPEFVSGETLGSRILKLQSDNTLWVIRD